MPISSWSVRNSPTFGSKIPDSTLSNPIRICSRRMLIEKDRSKVPRYINEIVSKCPTHPENIEIDSERLYGEILSDVYNATYPISTSVSEHGTTTWKNVVDFYSSHDLFKKASAAIFKTKDSGRSIYDRLPKNLNNLFLRSYSCKDNWELIRLTMQQLKMRKNTKWRLSQESPSTKYKTMYISQDYLLIRDTESSSCWWAMDYEQVMMIADTILARCFSMWYCMLNKYLPEVMIGVDVLTRVYSMWDKKIQYYGNSVYSYIKSWEPIIMGLMLRDHDILEYSDDFLLNIEKECRGDPRKEDTIKGMIDLLSGFQLNQFQLSELHGIFRHWGHPTVDEYAGCKKVRDILKTRQLPNYDMMQKSKSMFNRQMCLSFLSKHGRFPRMDLSGLKDKWRLKSVLKLGRTGFNVHSSDFPLHHWGKIRFKKEFDFDYSVDFTDKIDDKSISYYLHDLPCIYSPEILGYTPKAPISNRRLILEVLRTKEVDIKKICNIVMERKVPDSWKVILLSSKERELKIEPRLFAMMVLEMRLYFVVTEDNLSTTIFPYFPQQSMTMSELDLTKRLYQMSQNEYNDSLLSLFMSIDFKSWNIHWQYFSTEPIFSSLDDLFGTPGLYTYSHIFFSSCIIGLSSRFEVPKCFINNRKNWMNFDHTEGLFWRNHIGGLEGIRQKGWTLITIILLLIVESTTGIKSYIIGQGDNQILKLMIPIAGLNLAENREAFIKINQGFIRTQLTNYMDTLVEAAAKFCLVIKPDESWVSSSFINYGKDILYNGAYLSQVLKRISRTMPDINDAYPTITTKISSLQTTGYSCASKSFYPEVSQVICAYETLMMVRKESKFSLIGGLKYSKCFQEWCEQKLGHLFLLHGNTSIFGVPMLCPIDYLYRGHPDPLTSYLTFLSEFKDSCEICRGILIYLIHEEYELGDGEPMRIIDDPVDLNIKLPASLISIFKSSVTKKMVSITENKALREIFHANFRDEDKKLASYLIQSTPCFPRVLHEIKRQTPSHSRDHLMSKFGSARTVFNMMSSTESKTLNLKIINMELETASYWIERSLCVAKLGRQYMIIDTVCPSNLAQTLRNDTWSKTVGGKPILGVTIPHPYHQFKSCVAEGLDHDVCKEDTEFILFHSVKPLFTNTLLTRGPYQPYHGTKTIEKRSGTICQIPGYSRPRQAAQRLMQLYQWCIYPSDAINHFFQNMIGSRTNIPIEILEVIAGSISSGSQVHRLNDHVTKRNVTYNLRPNLSTHVYISSDSIGRFGRGSDNCNMHFSGAILMGLYFCNYITMITIADRLDLLHNDDIDTIHLHYRGSCCEEHLLDTKIRNDLQPPVIKSYKDNPLIYSRIQDYPLSTIPKSQCFSMTSMGGPPDNALAFLILSQIITSVSKNAWLPTADVKITLSKVSVRILIAIGIRKLMKELAVLLVLYYDLNVDKVLHMLNMFPVRTWQSIASACLLSELLTELFELSGNKYQPELFSNILGVSRLLNRGVAREVIKLKHADNWDKTSRVFFIVPGCGISKVFKMWSMWLYKTSGQRVDIRQHVQDLDFEIDVGLNLPRKESLDTLDHTLLLSKDPFKMDYVFKQHPLTLSELAPETVIGEGLLIDKRTKSERGAAIRPFKCTKFKNSTMEHLIEMPGIDRVLHNSDMKVVFDYHHLDKDRTFSDHAFHMVSNLSSSYLKIAQILDILDPDLSGDCVTLADGTGSIAKYLYKLTGKPVYFNTMVNTSSLLPQRAYGYIPSEFLDCPEGVKCANLSALYGGDITDMHYLSLFMKQLPEHVELVTSDAEGDKPFDHFTMMSIITHVLKVCVRTTSRSLIARLYLSSIKSAALVISAINVIYKKIYICVPTFCSNESFDCYVYATYYDPIREDAGSLPGSITNLHNIIVPTIADLVLYRRSEYPFMMQNPIWSQYLKRARSMGFQSSLAYHLERLINNLYPCPDEGINEKVFYDIRTYIDGLLDKQLKAIVSSYKGLPLPIESHLLAHRRASIHKSIEDILIAGLNLEILQDMLKYKSIEKTQQHIIMICTRVKNISIGEEIIYTYKNTFVNMRRDHIRSLWVLWGHYNLDMLSEKYG